MKFYNLDKRLIQFTTKNRIPCICLLIITVLHINIFIKEKSSVRIFINIYILYIIYYIFIIKKSYRPMVKLLQKISLLPMNSINTL